MATATAGKIAYLRASLLTISSSEAVDLDHLAKVFLPLMLLS